jgi:hypothetical protein
LDDKIAAIGTLIDETGFTNTSQTRPTAARETDR